MQSGRDPSPRVLAGRVLVVLVLAATVAASAAAADSPEATADPPTRAQVDQLKREIEDLRRQIATLSARLEAIAADRLDPAAPVESPAPDAVRQVAAPSTPDPAGVSAAVPPALAAAPPAAQAAPRTRTVFNPEISGVFQGIGSDSLSHDREEDGFSLSEAEFGFQGAVDPYARVDIFLTFTAEGEAEVEEGYVSTLSLPGGLKAKGGRFKNAFGKWNTLHPHRFFTVLAPDVLGSFFGEESLTSDGASMSWLVPGTGTTWLESITEVGSTGNDVSFNAVSGDLLYLQHLGAVFTLSPTATLGTGASGAFGKAGPGEALLASIDEAGLTDTLEPDDHLASNLFGADVTWKWKPTQVGLYRSATFQAEAFLSNRRVESLTAGGTLERDTIRSTGGYAYGEYQFARRWRAGLMYDATQRPDDESARERALSAVLRITPTEFQEFRIQFKHTSRNDAAAAFFDGQDDDNVILVEWIPVLGSHPAHTY